MPEYADSEPAQELPWQKLLHRPHQTIRRVRPEWIVPEVLDGTSFDLLGEPVLATGILVALLEEVTWSAVGRLLPSHLALLGRSGEYEHTAPAAVDDELVLEAYCVGGSARSSSWRAVAYNNHAQREGKIGALDHVVVATDRRQFRERLAVRLRS